MSEQQITDFVIWVGASYYSRESLIAEARKMGACRRVPRIPKTLVKGKSRVFLVSDMSEEDRKKYDEAKRARDRERYRQWTDAGKPRPDPGVTSVKWEMPRGEPQIFAYYVIRGIVYITSLSDEKIREELKERGIEKYQYIEGGFGFSDERGCGSLSPGGTYLLSEEDMEKVKDLAESGTLEGQIEVIDPPIPYDGKRFRGVKIIPRVQGDIWLGIQQTLTPKKHSWSRKDDGTSTCRNCGRTVETWMIKKGGLPKCGSSNQAVREKVT